MKNQNVIDIKTRRHFQLKKPWTPVPKGFDTDGRFHTFEMANNRFGFICGDQLVCRADFQIETLMPDTLVIDRTLCGDNLKTFSNAENPVAVVVSFVREVAQ